jgi:hypothetical protein
VQRKVVLMEGESMMITTSAWPRWGGWVGLFALVSCATGAARADEPAPAAAPPSAVQPRIDERFAAGDGAEIPDFRRHVLPLLGRLGCNGRACHGSFQGQGGFRLSLFGYDFKADHENLTAGESPRVDRAAPAASLMLQKPLEEEPHEGGHVLTAGSWQHRVLLQWIAGGAVDPAERAATFVALEVTPAELVAAAGGDQWQLRAVAVWSDGSREDVTPLCRFQSNDDQVATVDVAGRVTAVGPGDSHVVTFYDNGVVPVPVIFPVSDRTGPAYPDVPTPTPIDELVVAKLRKLGTVPAELCTDAEFLRRVSLDITGTPPTVAEVEAFLADTSPEKRVRKIDELLERPGYAAWWATKFCDWTGNNAQKNQNQGPDRRNDVSQAWYGWIHDRIARNVAYDEIVAGIVLARSRLDGESYEDYCRRMSGYMAKGTETSFADQPWLPYYWSRSNFRTTEERALGFAYTFLGVRIQCAQCHKHPFDQWTKDDFDRFENFFARVRYGEVPGTRDDAARLLAALEVDKKVKGNQLSQELATRAAKGQVVPFRETYVVAPTKPRVERPAKGERQRVVTGRTATVLGGEETPIDGLDDPREVLMDWMRDDDNPYFARAIVNRVWAGYFNVGIVEPPDDLSLANPPSNEPLLEWLATEFRTRGYDLKWLHREIARSDAYQRSWRTNDTNRLDERNFARAVPRRIPAEVLVDTVRCATAGDAEAESLQRSMKGRAIADPVVTGRTTQYALTVFGRSTRESNCDCDRTMEPSLLQTVYLQNDAELLALIGRKGGWVEQVLRDTGTIPDGDDNVRLRTATRAVHRAEELLAKAKSRDNEGAVRDAEKRLASARRWADSLRPPVSAEGEEAARAALTTTVTTTIRQAYLRTLGRPPEAAEVARAAAYFHDTPDLAVATRDLLWALLNTKEFAVNH